MTPPRESHGVSSGQWASGGIGRALINRVVEEQVDPTELIERRLGDLIDRVGVQDVRLKTERLAARGLDRRRTKTAGERCDVQARR